MSDLRHLMISLLALILVGGTIFAFLVGILVNMYDAWKHDYPKSKEPKEKKPKVKMTTFRKVWAIIALVVALAGIAFWLYGMGLFKWIRWRWW